MPLIVTFSAVFRIKLTILKDNLGDIKIITSKNFHLRAIIIKVQTIKSAYIQ